MLQFDEYKVKLNNLKPELDDLGQALGFGVSWSAGTGVTVDFPGPGTEN